MITVGLPPEALSRVRLVYSPMWELTTSLRLLVHEPGSVRHRPWIRWALQRVDPDLMSLLSALITTPYNYPDFLTPPPGQRPKSFARELAELTAVDPRRVRREVEATCLDGVPKRLRDVLTGADPMSVIAAALESYWRQALAPVWPRIRRVLAADVAFRADELAADGLHAVLNRLHPKLAFNGDELQLHMRWCEGERAGDTVHELALIPCAFGWPELLVVVTPDQPVSISYGPRGVAGLWLAPRSTTAQPLVDLLGRSRASILVLLDLPVSSTQIAEQTGLSLASVSQHVAVLRASGLVSTRRAGRTAWNVRTDLGNDLVSAPDVEHAHLAG